MADFGETATPTMPVRELDRAAHQLWNKAREYQAQATNAEFNRDRTLETLEQYIDALAALGVTWERPSGYTDDPFGGRDG